MDGSVFFPIGLGLVLLALILSAIGIRGRDKFPPSAPVMIGACVLFFAVVASTATLAVVNAEEEKEHRDEELAHEQEEAAAEQPAEKPPAGGGATLEVTSPEDGSLSFEPNSLQAAPGNVTISYDNPSPVVHNINVEGDGGVVAESDDVTGGATEITAQLQPGEYVFFCSIPGHREGGMEGDLLVE